MSILINSPEDIKTTFNLVMALNYYLLLALGGSSATTPIH